MEEKTSNKIFISYSRHDKKQVFKLKKEIDKYIGTKTCWLDLTGIESDEQFVDVIISAIDKSEIFLFMYSENSEKSKWTRKEVEYAQNKGKKIVFVKLSNTELSNYYLFQFGGHDIINIQDNDEKQKLLRNINSWINNEYDNKIITKPKTPSDISKKTTTQNVSAIEENTSAISAPKERVIKCLRKYKWHISAFAMLCIFGYCSTGLFKHNTQNDFSGNDTVFVDTACIDTVAFADTMGIEDPLKTSINSKDSTSIKKALLKDYLHKTDSICKLAENKKGSKHIIRALRDANYYYYYQAKYLTKILYNKRIERNIELDQLVGREYRYWVDKGNQLGGNKKNYAKKKEYYENAYKLRESKKLNSYIKWLDEQL